MSALYHFNAAASEVLELFLESAVPMIAGLAEVIGLFIIVTSLVKATFALRALMSLLLHVEMRGQHKTEE